MHVPCTFAEILVGIENYAKYFFFENLCLSFKDNWQERQYPLICDEWGVWTLTIPPSSDGSTAIQHGQAIKVRF